MTAASIAKDVQEVAAMVEAARAVVATGDLVDLDGLDARVARIMGEVKTVPARERRAIKPALIALIDSVTAMERAIVEKRDAIAHDLADLARRRRAVAAYGAPSGGAKDR